MKSKSGSSGNVIFALFAAIGIVGALGAAINSYLIGPLKSASNVNNRGAAEAQIDTSLRVALKNSLTRQVPAGGDCDSDGAVEPIPYEDAGANSKPGGGGYLPASIAGTVRDPWGTRYGYCVWDHGTASVSNAVPACGGATPRRLQGTTALTWPSVMIVSAGPDRIFQTNCNGWVDANADSQPDTPLIQRLSGSDDVYQSLNYDNSFVGGDEVWALEGGDSTTAEIDKIISVKDGSAVEQLSFNPTSVVLSLPDSSASGHFPTLRTNSIDRYNTTITNALDPVSILPEDGSGNEYYFRNPTGDALEMYQGTIASSVPKMGMSQSGLRVDYYMGDLNKYMRTRINGSTGTGLRLSSNANTSGYINGVEFLNTGYINGYSIFQTLRTTGGADPVLSAIYFHSMLAPVASSTVPTVTGLYGDLRFLTRPLGQAATDETALVERMRIRHDGRIQIGIVSDRSFHVEGGNTIVSGRVGINTDTPAAELHNFGREMTLRNGGESCVAAIEGAIRGNTTTQCIETCDGVAWKCMGVPTCANTAPTIASPFINNVNTAASTQYTSNIIPVVNTSCNNQFKVWGDGTPEYRLCPDATCSTNPAWQTASYDWPASTTYYVQLRNTSPAAVGTKRMTYIRLGEAYQSWVLSVQASCGSYATPIGTICADGTLYLGPSPDGYNMMYSSICAAGKTWDGTSCTGSATLMRWSTTGTINLCSNTSAPANKLNGRNNTTYLAAVSNTDAPYPAAQYCENLVQNGYSDWYLPAALELQNINVAARNGMLPSLYLTDPEITSGTWSSTAGDNPANSQCLNMSWTYNSNGVQARTRVTSYYVMCVRR